MLKREEGDISSDSISKKKLKAFHLELLVWKKKKINTLLFLSLLRVQFSPMCHFLLSLLNDGDCPLTVICSQCVR